MQQVDQILLFFVFFWIGGKKQKISIIKFSLKKVLNSTSGLVVE